MSPSTPGSPDDRQPDAPREEARAREPEAFPGKDVLSGHSAREVLFRLEEGDPLCVRERAAQAVLKRAILLDDERVFYRAIARAAYEARRYEGKPALDEWLERIVARSIGELLRQDRTDEQKGLPPEDVDAAHLRLEEVLRCEAGLGRRLALAFNALSFEGRRPFFAVAVLNEPIRRYALEFGIPEEHVKAELERVTTMLTRLAKRRPPRARGDDE